MTRAAPAPATGTASPPPLRALQLLGRWTRIAAQGALAIGSGGGCTCCNGIDYLPVSTLELELLDFLDGRHGGATPLGALLRDHAGYKPHEAGKLADLLKAIAAGKAHAVSEEAWGPFLEDLQGAIDSLDDIANGRLI